MHPRALRGMGGAAVREKETEPMANAGNRDKMRHGLPRRTLLRMAAAMSAESALLVACGGTEATPVPSRAETTAPPPPVSTASMSVGMSAPAALTTASPSATSVVTAPATGTMLSPTPGVVASVDGKLPSGVDGVPDAYTKPVPPFRSVATVPSKGGKVTALTIGYQPPPIPRDQNRFWQELEKRLGATWDVTIAPSASFGEKTSAVLSGGDLPELFYLNPDQNADFQRKVLDQGAFTDLTPYLNPDAIKEYPNLARYPPFIWKNSAFKGKIYGVPKPVLRSGNLGFYRSDWMRKLSLAPPKNADDLFTMLVAFAKKDPDGNGKDDTWGSGGTPASVFNLAIWSLLYRVPNDWRLNADGTLTKDLETDEYRQAVDFAHRLWVAGAFHPDSASLTSTQERDQWWAGKIGIHSEGFVAFWGNKGGQVRIRQNVGPDAEIVGLIPPGANGGQGVTYNLSGFFGFTAIPAKVGKDGGRVKELLRILDYLAAPFGSEEYNFLYYGIDGVDNDPQPDGSRAVNDHGRDEFGDLVYQMKSEYSFFYPGAPGDAEKAQALSKQSLAIGIDNPTFGLTSPTKNAKGPELTQLRTDRITEIITSRQPLAALDAYIKDWRSRGGDAIRKEFEQALKDGK